MSDYYYYKRYKKYKNLYKNLRAGGDEGSDKPVTIFKPGSRVKIIGLQNQDKFNQKTGTIDGQCVFKDHQERCFVLLDNVDDPDNQPGGIKPENLELISGTEPSESDDSGSEW